MVRGIQQAVARICLARDVGIHEPVVGGREHDVGIANIARLEWPPLDREPPLRDEMLEILADRGRNHAHLGTGEGKLTGLARTHGTPANNEDTKRGRLDENGQAAHRKRPPTLLSDIRIATYSTTTAEKPMLE